LAVVRLFEKTDGDGRRHQTTVVARVKSFGSGPDAPILQIDTFGSETRKLAGKTSQTLQFDRERAKELFDLLRDTYGFR
jgi:hypothetical protein